MEDSVKLINDAQREALAGIVVRRFSHRIAAAQEAADQIGEQIDKALSKPFDQSKPEDEIKRFRKLVDNIEARKRDLGQVRTLSEERDAIEQAVWLAADVEEAKRLVARVDAPQETAK